MKWISIKKAIGFGTLFCVFCPLFLSSSSFATTVDCSSFDLDSSRLRLNNQCDLTSLDNTKDWYYTTNFLVKPQVQTYRSFCYLSSSASEYCGLLFPNINTVQSWPSARYSTSLTNIQIFTDSFTSTGLHFDQIYSDGGWFSGYISSLTVSVSDSLSSGSCPECEECAICPVIPENPYDTKLDNITMAIYVCAGTALVIYFFYCIYRLIIKGVNK